MNQLTFTSTSDPRFSLQLDYDDADEAIDYFDEIAAPRGGSEYSVTLTVDGAEEGQKAAPVDLVHSLIAEAMKLAQERAA